MKRSLFSRDFLSLIAKGEDAPAPAPEQRRDEMEEDEVNLTLALSLGFGTDRKIDKLPRSSSAAALTTPAEVPAPSALPRSSSVPVQVEEHAPRLPASESPPSGSLESDGQQRLQGTLMGTSSLPNAIDAARNDEYKKRKEEQSHKRLEVKNKMIGRRNSTCSTSKEAAGGNVPEELNHTGNLVSCAQAVVNNNENHSSGMDVVKPRRGRPPKYQVTLTSQHSSSAAGKNPAFKGASVTMEPSSSSSVPSSSKATRSVTAAIPPLPPPSFAPRTAAAMALGSSSRGDQTIYVGRPAAVRANSMVDDVGRRLMMEMPAVYTKDLRSGNRVNGFLYKYRRAEEVKIICICHGGFFTPTGFVAHAGAGNGEIENPLRHIVVSPTPTL